MYFIYFNFSEEKRMEKAVVSHRLSPTKWTTSILMTIGRQLLKHCFYFILKLLKTIYDVSELVLAAGTGTSF
jgi:hypothetical protein